MKAIDLEEEMSKRKFNLIKNSTFPGGTGWVDTFERDINNPPLRLVVIGHAYGYDFTITSVPHDIDYYFNTDNILDRGTLLKILDNYLDSTKHLRTPNRNGLIGI